MGVFAKIRGWFRPAPPPAPEPPREPLHWRPFPWVNAVACGAEGLLPWTGELEHAGCERCKQRGYLIVLQRKVNTR